MASAETIEKTISTVLWQIENISFGENLQRGPYRIISPLFRLRNLDDQPCQLILYEALCTDLKYHLRVDIEILHLRCNISFYCEWSLLDGNESPLETWRSHFDKTKSEGILILKPPVGQILDIYNNKKHSYLPNLPNDTLTVRLRLWKVDGDFTVAEHISALTRFNVAERSFVWRIKGFSSLQNDVEVMAPVSLEFPNERNDLKLKFYLRGSTLDDSKFIFEILDEKQCEQSSTLKISVLDNKQNSVKCEENKRLLKYETWIISDFLSRKEVMEKKSEWLCGDELTLLFQFNAFSGSKHNRVVLDVFDGEGGKLKTGVLKNISSATKNDYKDNEPIKQNLKCLISTLSDGIWKTSLHISDQQPNTAEQNLDSQVTLQRDFQENLESVSTLQEDFLSLYTDHTLSDFKLRSGDVTFPVHKAVLSARSPVFRSMFCSDMKETSSDILDISDLDVHCVGRMLTFLYTGTMERELRWESAANLYYAADKYQVTTLKLECVSVLKSTLTISNVSKMLELADRHCDQEFMSSLHDFIVLHGDEVVLSEEWDAFIERNGNLAGKTMKYLYRKKRQLEG